MAASPMSLLLGIAFLTGQAAGHSWVVQVGEGANMGRSRGGIHGDDSELQRYFCPSGVLADCQPDPKHGVELTEEALRPCREGKISKPMAKVAAGDKLFLSWMGNGHVNNGQSDGTCVRLMLTDYAEDPALEDFDELPDGNCQEYWHWEGNTPVTNTRVEIPADTPVGKHTLLWYWDFTDFWYSSCADIEVLPQGSLPVDAPVSTPVPVDGPSPAPSDPKPEPEPEPEPNPEVPDGTDKPHVDMYLKGGCDQADIPKDFCQVYIGEQSYCKTWKPDECGRAVCQHGTFLLPCPKSQSMIAAASLATQNMPRRKTPQEEAADEFLDKVFSGAALF